MGFTAKMVQSTENCKRAEAQKILRWGVKIKKNSPLDQSEDSKLGFKPGFPRLKQPFKLQVETEQQRYLFLTSILPGKSTKEVWKDGEEKRHEGRQTRET